MGIGHETWIKNSSNLQQEPELDYSEGVYVQGGAECQETDQLHLGVIGVNDARISLMAWRLAPVTRTA